MDDVEYEVSMKIRLRSALDRQRLKNLLVIALWDEENLTPDGVSDELEVIEYDEIIVEEVYE